MSRAQTELTALSLLTDAEKAAVLDELMAGDVELERRAEQAGRRLLATVTTDHVASAGAEALLALDQDDLAAHAGRTRHGYIEPTEAEWRLLEQAVEPWIEDPTGRARLGLNEAARRLGTGTLQRLGASATPRTTSGCCPGRPTSQARPRSCSGPSRTSAWS